MRGSCRRGPRIPSGTSVPAIFSEVEGTAFIERQWGRQRDGEGLSLAIEEEARSKAVGLIALLFRPEPLVAGVGYWVIPQARGRRFAARARRPPGAVGASAGIGATP